MVLVFSLSFLSFMCGQTVLIFYCYSRNSPYTGVLIVHFEYVVFKFVSVWCINNVSIHFISFSTSFAVFLFTYHLSISKHRAAASCSTVDRRAHASNLNTHSNTCGNSSLLLPPEIHRTLFSPLFFRRQGEEFYPYRPNLFRHGCRRRWILWSGEREE